MDFIAWTADMAVGVEAIDTDHRTIISLVNKIHSAFANGAKAEQLNPLFHTLVTEIEEMFEREEALFDELNYPGAAEHDDRHQTLAVQLLEFDWEFTSEKEQIGFAHLEHAAALIVDHFKSADRAFGEFYRSRRSDG